MPSYKRLARSTGLRLAVLQTVLFLLTFLLAGGGGLIIIRRAELRAAHAELEELEDDFTDRFTHLGLRGAIDHFNIEHRDEGRDFRVENAAGDLLGGGLPRPPAQPGQTQYWTTYPAGGPGQARSGRGPVLAYIHGEPGGVRLVVGEFLVVREREDQELLVAIMLAAGGVAAVGLAFGALVSFRVQRRIDVMSDAVERFGSGDRSSRIPAVDPPRVDLDELSLSLNRMMERETRLVDGLRQTTWAIAHDLRRPLAQHNQVIAEALCGPDLAANYRATLEQASMRVEEVLQTFQALLHIAELEAGAPELDLTPVDLRVVAARVVEAYRPAAEEGNRALSFRPCDSASLLNGEPRVLGRLIANLVENALAYTPEGTKIEVTVEPGPRLTVTDNGPGVAGPDRERIFERFYRLDSSRSSDGAGLGLALAAAAARAFGGLMWAEDAMPGLRIVADFSGRPQKL